MKVLVVIDMQNDFIDGPLGTPEARAIVPKVVEKIKQYTSAPDGVVVFTRDTHYQNYMETLEGKKLPVPHCIKDTDGWRIHDDIYDEDSYVLDKTTFGRHNIGSAVWMATLEKYGKAEIESIEVVGVCTDICVVSNVLILKAYYEDTPIIVDSSCCAGVTPEKHAAALEVMRSCHIEVV